MRQIPEQLDLEEISKACDRLLKYMREHPSLEQPMVDAMSQVCAFITRTKNNVEWLELIIQRLKEGRTN